MQGKDVSKLHIGYHTNYTPESDDDPRDEVECHTIINLSLAKVILSWLRYSSYMSTLKPQSSGKKLGGNLTV